MNMTMGRFKGFGSLKTPADLLLKIQYDFVRLRDAPNDIYAAFDFFVSAYHMLDWLHPNDVVGRKTEETNNILLQVCSHLANGAKHFEATNKRHSSVGDVVAGEGKFFGGSFFGGAFFRELSIQLDGQAATIFGEKIGVVDFAKTVLTHWETDPRLAQ